MDFGGVRFERERERKLAAHRRAVLRKESEVFERERKLRELKGQLHVETEKLKAAAAEFTHLHKVREASVALNVWQPEVVRGKQEKIVEQCSVPIESRIHSLEMELKLCKQQVTVYNRAYKEENQRLERAREELASMKYHPLRDYSFTSSGDTESSRKQKKLKRCNSGEALIYREPSAR